MHRASQVVNKRNPCQNIGTWNVRTMRKEGKMENVKREMKKHGINALGLSEARWKDEGEFRDEGYYVVHSGSTKGLAGVAFILDKEAAAAMVDVKVYSDRLMSVKIAADPVDVVLIQAYMPTSTQSDQEVEDIYDQIEEMLRTTKAADNVIIMDDWNAIVGEGEEDDTVGKYGLGTRNARGQRLVDFCTQEEYVITNTWFQVPKRRRYTWVSPGDQYRNQIDYILVKKRYRNQVKKAIAYPGADADTDHSLVKATCRLHWKRMQKAKRKPAWNIEALRQNNVKARFQQEVKKRVEDMGNTADVECQWQGIKGAITEAAELAIGYATKTPAQPWITPAILEKMDQRAQWKNIKTDEGKTNYRRLKNEIDRDCRKAREAWYTERCKEVEQLENRGRSDLAHRLIRRTAAKKKGITPRTVQAKDGRQLINAEEKKERWREYVTELYHDDSYEPSASIEPIGVEGQAPPITREEFDAAMKEIPNSKAPGVDEIPIELIRAGGDEIANKLYELVKLIWDTGKWPADYTMSAMIPLPKKSNATDCCQYRTISLISHASKILLKIIKKRIDPKIHEVLGENQYGFRPGVGTRDAMATLRILSERMLEQNRTLYVCFIDYEKAFDRLPWNKLFPILRRIGVEEDIVRLIQSLYENQQARIVLKEGETAPVQIRRGSRQGCLLSPGVYNGFSEVMMNDALGGCESGIRVNGECINTIKFADDQAVIAGSARTLQILVDRINKVSHSYGMKINIKKTKVMTISKNPRQFALRIDGEPIEQVESFKYLGQTITQDGRCETEVRMRIAMAKAAFREKQNLLCARNTSISLRKRIMKAYVWTVATYGAETWTLNKKEESQLEAFEMWCYRRMERISWTEHKTNDAVLIQVGETRKLLRSIQRKRLSYLGHVLRHDNLVHRIVEGRLEGKRGRGRPRNNFVAQACKGASVATYSDLKSATQDRHKWRDILRQL